MFSVREKPDSLSLFSSKYVMAGVCGRPHERVLMNEKQASKELDKLLVFLGGVKRLVDGMYTVGLYTIVEGVVRGLHIRKKGPRDFAQRSTESRCYRIRPCHVNL